MASRTRACLAQLVIASACLATPAMAHADCAAEIAIIDERIAGKPDDYRRQVVEAMRQSLLQMCPHLDAEARQAMLDNLDKIYPSETGEPEPREPKSLSQQLAEKQTRAAERRARKQAKREAREAEMAARPPRSESDVMKAPATAVTVSARHIDRSDEMHQLWIRDWDRYRGNLRVLYTTFPDLPQYGLPDWQFYVYVVEVDPAGRATQRLVTSKQASDHGALALRRGHDEVFFLRHVDRTGEPSLFERWSISGKNRLSSSDLSDFQPEVGGHTYRSMQFGVPTSDGNLLFGAVESTGRDAPNRVAWFKLGPAGQLLGSGELEGIADTVAPYAWFATVDAGGGMIAHVRARSSAGLASGEMASFDRSAFPAGVEPAVMSEKRLYLIDGAGKLAWESTALERMMMFEPGSPLPKKATMAQMQSRMSDQNEARVVSESRYRTGRTVDSLDIGPSRREMIKPMRDGYAALITLTADRRLQPPIHGQYLVELNRKGVTQEIYLNPLAEQLDAKFTAFEPGSGNGEFYLLASQHGRQAHVIRMDHEGHPIGYGTTADVSNFDLQRATLVADGSGVWVLGDQWMKGVGKPLVWIERIDFAR